MLSQQHQHLGTMPQRVRGAALEDLVAKCLCEKNARLTTSLFGGHITNDRISCLNPSKTLLWIAISPILCLGRQGTLYPIPQKRKTLKIQGWTQLDKRGWAFNNVLCQLVADCWNKYERLFNWGRCPDFDCRTLNIRTKISKLVNPVKQCIRMLLILLKRF